MIKLGNSCSSAPFANTLVHQVFPSFPTPWRCCGSVWTPKREANGSNLDELTFCTDLCCV